STKIPLFLALVIFFNLFFFSIARVIAHITFAAEYNLALKVLFFESLLLFLTERPNPFPPTFRATNRIGYLKRELLPSTLPKSILLTLVFFPNSFFRHFNVVDLPAPSQPIIATTDPPEGETLLFGFKEELFILLEIPVNNHKTSLDVLMKYEVTLL